MISVRAIALAFSIICLATSAWANLQAGMDAYNSGDYATALSEWRPLAEQGDALAQYNLGFMYSKGQGVQQDYTTARQWYEQAAAQGDALAQSNLGLMHTKGLGVPQDYTTARQWYEQAAAQGEAVAQFNLGVVYHNGEGVPQDFVQAHKWYNLAGANGYKKAVDLRNVLSKVMTPAQIAEAQKLAREWKPIPK